MTPETLNLNPPAPPEPAAPESSKEVTVKTGVNLEAGDMSHKSTMWVLAGMVVLSGVALFSVAAYLPDKAQATLLPLFTTAFTGASAAFYAKTK